MPTHAGQPGICQMLDYGMYNDAYWIVMRRYRCSLAEWRSRQKSNPPTPTAARMYLSIFLQVRVWDVVGREGEGAHSISCASQAVQVAAVLVACTLQTPSSNL
jgi:hypothetical protein